MKTKKPKKNTTKTTMSYETRIRRYEEEKEELLRNSYHLSAAEFQERIEALITKWNI